MLKPELCSQKEREGMGDEMQTLAVEMCSVYPELENFIHKRIPFVIIDSQFSGLTMLHFF